MRAKKYCFVVMCALFFNVFVYSSDNAHAADAEMAWNPAGNVLGDLGVAGLGLALGISGTLYLDRMPVTQSDKKLLGGLSALSVGCLATDYVWHRMRERKKRERRMQRREEALKAECANDNTPVQQAIEQKNVALLQSLIDAKANLDVKDEDSRNAYVVQALCSGNNEVLACLLRARVPGVSAAYLAYMPVNSSSGWRAQAQTFLDNGYALHNCDVDWIERVIENTGAVDSPASDIDFLIAHECRVTTDHIINACFARSMPLVQYLIEKRNVARKQVDLEEERDHYAALSEELAYIDDCPLSLLYAGADIEKVAEEKTILHRACDSDDLVKSHMLRHILMVMGADPTKPKLSFNERAQREGLQLVLDLPIEHLIHGTASLAPLPQKLKNQCFEAVCARARYSDAPKIYRNRVVAWIWGHKEFIEQSPEVAVGYRLPVELARIVLDYYRCADAQLPDPYADRLLAQAIKRIERNLAFKNLDSMGMQCNYGNAEGPKHSDEYMLEIQVATAVKLDEDAAGVVDGSSRDVQLLQLYQSLQPKWGGITPKLRARIIAWRKRAREAVLRS